MKLTLLKVSVSQEGMTGRGTNSVALLNPPIGTLSVMSIVSGSFSRGSSITTANSTQHSPTLSKHYITTDQ